MDAAFSRTRRTAAVDCRLDDIFPLSILYTPACKIIYNDDQGQSILLLLDYLYSRLGCKSHKFLLDLDKPDLTSHELESQGSTAKAPCTTKTRTE
jgi:hypothetical protein